MRTEPSHPLRAALGDYRLALGSRAYRRLWLAAVISRTGDTLNFTALPLLVFGLTHSPAAVGTVVFAEGIGLIGGGILAQSIVDRLPARRLLVTLDLLRAAAAVLLVIFPTFPLRLRSVSYLGSARHRSLPSRTQWSRGWSRIERWLRPMACSGRPASFYSWWPRRLQDCS